MKKRGLIISVLVMLAVITSGFTYAFWAAGIAASSNTKTGTIKVGAGETVQSAVSITEAVSSQGENQKLVPAGFADGDEITSLTLQFNVTWTSADENSANGGDAKGLESTLTVAKVSAMAGSTDVSSLFNVTGTLSYSITSDAAAPTLVTVTVTMNEPGTIALYQAVANQNVVLTLSFSVAATSTPAA